MIFKSLLPCIANSVWTRI